jgi:peroxiredoxin
MMIMKLQDTLDQFTASLIASGAIADAVVAELTDGIAEQIASGAADRALKAGQLAPTFALEDADGLRFNSTDLLRRGPLVLSFYRGVWCPYCNMELAALEAARPSIEAHGASIVAVSMQNAANSRRSARENGLHFPILVDTGGAVAAQFGLRYTVSARVLEIYRQLGNDLHTINGEDSGALPMPGLYLVGLDGVVAYAEVDPDYTKRPDPNDLLPLLDLMQRRRVA